VMSSPSSWLEMSWGAGELEIWLTKDAYPCLWEGGTKGNLAGGREEDSFAGQK